MRPRVSHGVAAAAALGALTLGGVAAAAYTGSLPSSIQRLAHDHLGAPQNDRPRPRPVSTHPSHPRPSLTALRSSRPAGDEGQPGLSAATPTPTPSSRGSTRGASPSASPSLAAERVELCNDYATARLHGDDHDAAAAYHKLAKAAGGRDKVFEYCAPVWSADTGGRYDQDPQDPRHSDVRPPVSTVPESPYERPPR